MMVRCAEAMSSSLPSAAIDSAVPDEFFLVASKRIVQLVTSSRIAATGTASGPGLMVPVTVLPSQAITIVMCVLDVVEGPQSPDHVPVRGCPSCAGAAEPAHADQQRNHHEHALAHITPPGTRPRHGF